jgi:hypothetical protein
MNSSIMRQWWRLGGISGILFLVLFLIGGSMQAEPPMYDDPVEEIRAHWVDEGGTYLTGDYIIGVGFILFFFPFLSALTSLLGNAEGGTRMWSRIAFAGGVLFLALAATTGVFWTTLAFGDFAENASDDTIMLVMHMDVAAAHFIPAGLAILTLPAALVMFQTRVLPIWLAVLTLVVGVLATIAPAGILAENPSDSVLSFIAFPIAGIWVLVTSIVLVLRKDAPVAEAGTTASSAAVS